MTLHITGRFAQARHAGVRGGPVGRPPGAAGRKQKRSDGEHECGHRAGATGGHPRRSWWKSAAYCAEVVPPV